jgi:hypothetical protein
VRTAACSATDVFAGLGIDPKVTVLPMNFTPDPNDRPRLDTERKNARDADVWARRLAGQSFRQIARAIGIPASSVQRCFQRASKREAARQQLVLDVAPAEARAADEVATIPELWPALSALERYRLSHLSEALASSHAIPPLHDPDHQLCCIAHGHDPNWRPDDGTGSWREVADHVRADDTDGDW